MSTGELKINHHFHNNFLKSSPLPHGSHDFGGFQSEKQLQNRVFFCVLLLCFFVFLLVTFFDKNSYLGVTHRFALIKLTFTHVQPLVSNRPTCAKFHFCIPWRYLLPPLSHEVLILEEELQGFSMAFNIFILHNL
jgi:hypothetical protein